jgi:hypothetical protein
MRSVYLGRDNTFDLLLLASGIPVNANAFNRQVLYLRDPKTGNVVTIDSSTAAAGTFDTTQQQFYNYVSVNVLRCKLGLGSFGLVADVVYEGWLRMYSATFTNGLVWPDHNDTFRLRVLSGP